MNLRNSIPTESLDFLAEITSTHLSLDMIYGFYGIAIACAALLFCVGVAVFGRGGEDSPSAGAPARGDRITPAAP